MHAVRRTAFAAAATLGLAALAGCPPEPTPTAWCALCVEEKCHDLAALCDADADCACVNECFGAAGGGGVDGCVAQCGLDERPARFFDVEECAAGACPDAEDECATPAGYQPPDDGSVLSTSEPIGGGELADCALDDAAPFDPTGELLQLQSLDGAVCVRLERSNDGPGESANTAWTLLRARLGPLGAVADVAAAADLCWYSSHHNFSDWAHVWTGTRRHALHVEELGHGGTRTFTLHTFADGPLETPCAATAEGSEPIGAPLRLFPFE